MAGKYNNILIEHFHSQLEAIHEYVKYIPEMREDIGTLKDDVSGLKMRADIAEGLLKEHSRDLSEIKTSVIFQASDISELKAR